MQVLNIVIPILFVLTFVSGLYCGNKMSMQSFKLGWRSGHAARNDVEIEDIEASDPGEFQVLDKQEEEQASNVMSE